MDQEVTGLMPGEAAAPEQTLLAERLMRDEFAEDAHRAWFHRDVKGSGPGVPSSIFDDTAQVPVVAAAVPADDTAANGAGSIHEEFAEPARPPRFRSHRAGMLAGLGVVGALLAVLVLLGPSGGKPRLPAQSVHDVSPISASGPKTAAATTPPPPAPSTTSSAPASSTTTTPAHQSVTQPSTVTYVYLPGTTTPAQTPTPTTTAPAATATPTTSPPAPTTTTTTSPPTTTSTTSCLLIICN